MTMRIIVSVLSGLGAGRIVEWFGVSDTLVLAAVFTTTIAVSIGLLVWKES